MPDRVEFVDPTEGLGEEAREPSLKGGFSREGDGDSRFLSALGIAM